MNWFYTLDSLEKKVDFIPRVKEVQIKYAIKIIKYYNLYDNEVENMEKQLYSEEAEEIKGELSDNIDWRDAIYEGMIDSDEEDEGLRYEDQELEEEDCTLTESEITDSEINGNIYKFERLMRSYDNIYDFKKKYR